MAKSAPKNTKPAPGAAPETVTLEAVEPIRIDGVDVAVGETFAASSADAKALLASGAAKE